MSGIVEFDRIFLALHPEVFVIGVPNLRQVRFLRAIGFANLRNIAIEFGAYVFHRGMQLRGVFNAIAARQRVVGFLVHDPEIDIAASAGDFVGFLRIQSD